MPPRVRFAPSPTGHLHLGNARTALVNWLFARRHGGRFVLRIDDTDVGRSKPEFETAIHEDLAWLGLSHDECFRQSQRLDVYLEAFERLRAAGRAYPAYETADELAAKRAAQRARGLPPRYDRAALRLAAAERAALEAQGRQPHWRFLLDEGGVLLEDLVLGPRHIPSSSLSDPILLRADGSPTYIFASSVDDMALEISHVIRGADHVVNAAVQQQIIAALAHAPPAFAHLPLIQDEAGQGLSKRLGSLSLRRLRADGIVPLAICQVLAALGTAAAPNLDADLDELARKLDLAAFGRASPRLAAGALERASLHHLRRMPFEELRPRLENCGLGDIDPQLWRLVRENVASLDELEEWQEICRGEVTPVIEDAELTAAAAALLPAVLADIDAAGAWLEEVRRVTGRKGKALFHPIRLAVTGRGDGPALKHLLPLIGRERIRRRLLGERA